MIDLSALTDADLERMTDHAYREAARCYGGGAMIARCDHCGAPFRRPADAAPGDVDYHLCPDDADMAVWGAACADCDRVPIITRGRVISHRAWELS